MTIEKIQEQMITYLSTYKKKRIDLETLQHLMDGHTVYERFAEAVLELEKAQILTRNKSSKENKKGISLAYQYHITHHKLNTQHQNNLHKTQLTLDTHISLESYFHIEPKTYEMDFPFIERIDTYLKSKGLPNEQKTLPKLSYELVQDEKWLQEKGGIKLLKRIKLWQHLQPAIYFEPVIFALNPKLVQEAIQHHLIVENKTPFIELMEALKDAPFTSIVYGSGWQIVSIIHNFKVQMGTNCEDRFYYFGDLDYEGIHIWHSLSEQVATQLALPFYQRLLKHGNGIRKNNQKMHLPSMEAFLNSFDKEEQIQIANLLQMNGYYPQEILSKAELHSLLKAYPLNRSQED